MAYKKGNRRERILFPVSVDEYINKDDMVRVYDKFIEKLDFNSLGIRIDYNKRGNSSYNPRMMLKLLVYSYSYGINSSRKIEKALHHNLSYIWLSENQKPDHKTISNFRKNNKDALKKVLKYTARLSLKLGFISGNILFTDGTKMRGNCSINKTFTKEYLESIIDKLDEKINKIIKTSEHLDSINNSFIKADKKIDFDEIEKQMNETIKDIKKKDYEKIKEISILQKKKISIPNS